MATRRSTISCATGSSPASATGESLFPMVDCEKCGWVPLPENELPLRLPEMENYEPTDNGESPWQP